MPDIYLKKYPWTVNAEYMIFTKNRIKYINISTTKFHRKDTLVSLSPKGLLCEMSEEVQTYFGNGR